MKKVVLIFNTRSLLRFGIFFKAQAIVVLTRVNTYSADNSVGMMH